MIDKTTKIEKPHSTNENICMAMHTNYSGITIKTYCLKTVWIVLDNVYTNNPSRVTCPKCLRALDASKR